jgi:muramoyltetrapeptide carboxypeptidase
MFLKVIIPMTIIKPYALKKRDVVGIIAPASPTGNPEKITKGIEYLERIGYRVKLGKNVNNVYGYLAGKDKERVSDIHDMFLDNSVKAIFALRGGYGTPRLLPLLDYSLIRKNPKILVGYSDVTALQLAIFKKTGLVSFSGPMSGVEMWKGIDPFTEENFWRMVTSKKKFGTVKNPDDKVFLILRNGKASGRTLGGNLSLITSLLGTPYLPSFKSSILFFEEVDEECYHFDRMLNQLRLSKILNSVNGVIVGELTDVKPSDDSKPFLSSDQLLNEYLSPLNKPVLTGVAFGHVPKKITIPIGIQCTMDTTKQQLSFDEPAVR